MAKLNKSAGQISEILKNKEQTISVVESSSGGLISAALLSQPGASQYYMGGQVVYTAKSIRALTGLRLRELKEKNIRSSSEPFALLIAQKGCAMYDTDWCIGETGAAGPTGNGYGDPSGYSCYAVAGIKEKTNHIFTNSNDRIENMLQFSERALNLNHFIEVIDN